MLQVRCLKDGKEDVIDLSKKCHEMMTDEQILRMFGTGGVIRELRQECDFMCGESALTEYMSRELAENEAEIYMSDELSGERFFIIFSDSNMAHYLKMSIKEVAGAIDRTYKRVIQYIENYYDDDGFGCDELMYIALVSVYEMNRRSKELSMEDFFCMFKNLKEHVERYDGNTPLGTCNSGEDSLSAICGCIYWKHVRRQEYLRMRSDE